MDESMSLLDDALDRLAGEDYTGLWDAAFEAASLGSAPEDAATDAARSLLRLLDAGQLDVFATAQVLGREDLRALPPNEARAALADPAHYVAPGPGFEGVCFYFATP